MTSATLVFIAFLAIGIFSKPVYLCTTNNCPDPQLFDNSPYINMTFSEGYSKDAQASCRSLRDFATCIAKEAGMSCSVKETTTMANAFINIRLLLTDCKVNLTVLPHSVAAHLCDDLTCHAPTNFNDANICWRVKFFIECYKKARPICYGDNLVKLNYYLAHTLEKSAPYCNGNLSGINLTEVFGCKVDRCLNAARNSFRIVTKPESHTSDMATKLFCLLIQHDVDCLSSELPRCSADEQKVIIAELKNKGKLVPILEDCRTNLTNVPLILREHVCDAEKLCSRPSSLSKDFCLSLTEYVKCIGSNLGKCKKNERVRVINNMKVFVSANQAHNCTVNYSDVPPIYTDLLCYGVCPGPDSLSSESCQSMDEYLKCINSQSHLPKCHGFNPFLARFSGNLYKIVRFTLGQKCKIVGTETKIIRNVMISPSKPYRVNVFHPIKGPF